MNQADKPIVSIIIATHNRKELVCDCLKSLHRMESPAPFEVIVINNGSDDGTEEELKSLAKKIRFELKILKNEKNLGFARANNHGAALAKAGTLLFLNNDTIIEKDFLQKPLELLKTGNIGIVGIQLRFPDGLIQHAGIAFNDEKSPNHVSRYYRPENPLVRRSRYLQAVTGACLFISKELFINTGGFDEAYRNGWEDIDLCFRIREKGCAVYYCGDVWIYHLESQSENRLTYASENQALFQKRWLDAIQCDEKNLYELMNLLGSVHSQKSRPGMRERIRFAINIGVPNRSHTGWGDEFFAKSLSRALKAFGHHCVIRYLNEWDRPPKPIDVVIHLKGLSKYTPRPEHLNVLWILNHPEMHKIEELNAYDIVFVASPIWCDRIRQETQAPVYYLPQAGDEIAFTDSAKKRAKDIDVLFVGNNYGAERGKKVRAIIADLLESKIVFDLKVVGRRWENVLGNSQWISEFCPWEELPELYGRARIVLNDHQDSMKECGFINNRTFDLAHLGVFQISNEVAGLKELGVVTYNDPQHLAELIRYYLDNEEEREKKAAEVREMCREYSFGRAASTIISQIRSLTATENSIKNCNICNYSGKFLNMGQRQNARCPKCNSLERQRALWFLLNREGLIRPGMRVLEISPLTNSLFRDYFVREGCSYYCCDKWRTGNPLDRRDSGFIDIQTDVAQLAFKKEAFDLVLMQHVIEEVPDDIKAFEEIARVLKRSGAAILEIPYHRHMGQTREFETAGKFGNLRAYGADIYGRLSAFNSREEAIIDNIPFSILRKDKTRETAALAVLLEHPAADPEWFDARFGSMLDILDEKGFAPLTVYQVENFLNGIVNYRRPVWITMDDGQKQDITKALPHLTKHAAPATSFIIPGRMSPKDWELFSSAERGWILQLGSHSMTHRLIFTSTRLIDIWSGQAEYRNLFLKGEPYGYPVFEHGPALASREMLPKPEALNFCLSFYGKHESLSRDEYIKLISRELEKEFPEGIGRLESEKEHTGRLETEITGSRLQIREKSGVDPIAFAFPWGKTSPEATKIVEKNHAIAVHVGPSRINIQLNKFGLTRIPIGSSAALEFESAFFRTRPWESLAEVTSEPVVCVLMPTYNGAETLIEAIQSVVDQSFKNWNLIVVNDGGENVGDIVRSFEDPRIVYLEKDHRGKGAALNHAIRNSKSKYIAYLDDDDCFYPNHLEVLVGYLEAHREARFAYSISRETAEYQKEGKWEAGKAQLRYAFQGTVRQMLRNNFIPNLAALHERKLLDDTGLYNEELDVLIDWYMYRRLAAIAAPVFVNCVTSEYRRRKKGEQGLKDRHLTALFDKDILRYYRNRLKITGDYFCIQKATPLLTECIFLSLADENEKDAGNILCEMAWIRAQHPCNLALLVGKSITMKNLPIIQYAELLDIFVVWNSRELPQQEFLNDFIASTCWKKYYFLGADAQSGIAELEKPENKIQVEKVNLKLLHDRFTRGIKASSQFAKELKDSVAAAMSQSKNALVICSAPIQQVRQVVALLREGKANLKIHLFGRSSDVLSNAVDLVINYEAPGSYVWEKITPESLKKLEVTNYDLVMVPVNNYEGKGYENIENILKNLQVHEYFAINPVMVVELRRILEPTRDKGEPNAGV